MTELETIAHAKMYLDKLARGIDPLTNQPVPEGDVVSQVRLSRCFLFVSDVLGRVLENGGITAPEAVKKVPFEITPEQLGRVRLSGEPLRITELCQRITEATGQENMTRLAPSLVLEWLEGIGMLEKKQTLQGKQSRRPTAAGRQLGIFEEERSGTYGAYVAVLYTEAAQRLIVENLGTILRSRPPR